MTHFVNFSNGIESLWELNNLEAPSQMTSHEKKYFN